MKNRSLTVKYIAAVLAFSVWGTSFAFADVITDVPVLSGEEVSASVQEEEMTAPAETTAAAVSYGSLVTGDRPAMLLEDSTQSVPETEAPAGTEAAGGTENTPVLSDEPGAVAASGSVTGIENGPVPETAQETGASSEAPAVPEETKAPEQSVPEPATAPDPGAVSGPTAQSQRVYLDFEIASPAHKSGSFNVASAAVKLSDGSWQYFGYSDNVRWPYYKIVSHGTDGKGNACVIAKVSAKRFGDATTDDGEQKSELYLKASDCTVTNYIDIPTQNPVRVKIVKAALSLLGKQYTYGGNGPDAFDCSGLVKYVMSQAGVDVPRTSTSFLSMDRQISESELKPGDVLARSGHCGVYIGNGIFIHASESPVGVVAEYLSVYNTVNRFTNYVNVVGD